MTRALKILLALAIAGSSAASAQATSVILVRHAEKSAPTGDPGLTPAGVERAHALARSLEHVRLGGVITSQYLRTRLTAAPVAAAQGVEIMVVPTSRDLAAAAAEVVAALDRLPAGSTALVVGHSNTLGSIIAALSGPRIPDLCDSEHSTMFVLERPGAGKPVSLVRARYGAADPEECP